MRSVVTGVFVLLAGCTFVVGGIGLEDGVPGGDGGGMPVGGRMDAAAMEAGAGGMDAAVAMDLAPPEDLMRQPLPPGRRKAITIDDKKVAGNLSDFPVWIDLTDEDIAARAQSDGKDIYFTAANGKTRLDHELQGWDGKRLTAWVRVPSLAAKSPTVLYVYYGDLLAAPVQKPAGVFSSGFGAVWHLDDALPAVTIAEATGMRPGTPSFKTTTRVEAKLGSGLAFTGDDDFITFTNVLSGNQPHTISVWVNQKATADPSAVLVVGSPIQNQSRWFYTHFMTPVMAIGFYSNDWTTTTGIDNAGWTLVHWVFEGGNGRNRIYVNGVEIAGSPQTLNDVNTQGATGFIGYAPEPAYGSKMGLLGTLDELRIATVARSQAWIATEYANQSAPGTFYTVGAEELAP